MYTSTKSDSTHWFTASEGPFSAHNRATAGLPHPCVRGLSLTSVHALCCAYRHAFCFIDLFNSGSARWHGFPSTRGLSVPLSCLLLRVRSLVRAGTNIHW